MKQVRIPPRRVEPLRNRLRKEYLKNFQKSYELPLSIHIDDLMRELIVVKDANKVLKSYYYVNGHLYPELEKEVS
jgi:hypothetical protein